MQNAMMKLVLESRALSIWNRKTGPVFWGAAKVPMPFYINTELMIGRELASDILEKITSICRDTTHPAARAEQLKALLLPPFERTKTWQDIIDALTVRETEVFPDAAFGLISGGERRDWLFSVPYAEKRGLPHLYLFKDKSTFCATSQAPGTRALHVCDLVNNAASHFEAWFPMLEKAGLSCPGTLAVNTRGSKGTRRLTDAGYKVGALNSIDIGFFDQSVAKGMMDKDTRDEMALFFQSEKEWAATYLLRDPSIFNLKTIDAKSHDRLRSFFTEDPWALRADHAAFFEAMEARF